MMKSNVSGPIELSSAVLFIAISEIRQYIIIMPEGRC